MSTVTAREHNQHPSAVKRAAAHEPVIITDRGKPTHVLMSYDEYERITGDEPSLVDLLMMPDDDIDFEPVINRSLPKFPDL